MIKILIKLLLLFWILFGCNISDSSPSNSIASSASSNINKPSSIALQMPSITPVPSVTIRSRKTIIYEDSIVTTVIKSDELLPYDVWVEDKFIYVANGTKKTLSKIDMNTRQIVKTFSFEGSCTGVTGDIEGNIYTLIHIGYYSGGQKIIKILKDDVVTIIKHLPALGYNTDLLFTAGTDATADKTGCVVKDNNLLLPNSHFIDSLNLNSLEITRLAGRLATIDKTLPDKEGKALEILFSCCINDIDTDSKGDFYFCGDNIQKFSNGYITTIVSGYPSKVIENNWMGIDGEITAATVNRPDGIAIDKQRNYIYFSNGTDNTIRKISIKEGKITTVGGKSIAIYRTDEFKHSYLYGNYKDGKSDEAMFNTPGGLAVDKEGNVYVADGGNNAIRKITFPESSDSSLTPSLYPSPTPLSSPSAIATATP